MTLIVPVLLILSTLSLAFGMVLPLVLFEKLYFFSETPSLFGIVAYLWVEENRTLAAVVGLLSIVFPVIKLIAIAFEVTAPVEGEAEGGPHERLFAKLLPLLARWSMVDVMLVSLVIFAAKTSGVAEAFTQPGLWFYTASAIMTGLLQMQLRPQRVRPQ